MLTGKAKTLEEIEKGYLLYDKVLRHAKVIVTGDNSEESISLDQDQNSKTLEKNSNKESS